MKRALFVFIIASCFVVKGQNYIITMYDTVKYGNCGDLLLPTVTFSSTTGNPVQMHFKRILKNIPTGWTSCFCAPSCIPQTQDTMNFTIPAVGDKNNPPYQNVTPNFGTDSISGVGEVIVVFNEIGVNHYDTIYFRGFTSCLAGIKEFGIDGFAVSPNPSNDVISISGFKKGIQAVRLLDIIGEVVYTNSLQDYQYDLNINISELPTGQYLLLIHCSDNTIYKKKIIKL